MLRILTPTPLLLTGCLLSYGQCVVATSEDNWTNATRFDTLTTVNAVGCAAAGIGGSLVAIHLVRGARMSVGARAVRVSGTF